MAILQVMSHLIPSSPYSQIKRRTIPSTSLCLNHPGLSSSSSSFELSLSKRNFRIRTTFTIACSASANQSSEEEEESVKEKSVSVVLLAGGKGKRMGVCVLFNLYLPILFVRLVTRMFVCLFNLT
ncbi:putative 2-C-methyl-D-erythritol 4-phosphate cytidylyltransferase [Helianthus debilis subsp. tardiflorus]